MPEPYRVPDYARPAAPPPAAAPPAGGFDEAAFRRWYAEWAKRAGIDPNPDDPRHGYDYRAAYKAGATPKRTEDGSLHWPSEFKTAGNPRLLLAGEGDDAPAWSGRGRAFDTKSGKWLSEAEALASRGSAPAPRIDRPPATPLEFRVPAYARPKNVPATATAKKQLEPIPGGLPTEQVNLDAPDDRLTFGQTILSGMKGGADFLAHLPEQAMNLVLEASPSPARTMHVKEGSTLPDVVEGTFQSSREERERLKERAALAAAHGDSPAGAALAYAVPQTIGNLIDPTMLLGPGEVSRLAGVAERALPGAAAKAAAETGARVAGEAAAERAAEPVVQAAERRLNSELRQEVQAAIDRVKDLPDEDLQRLLASPDLDRPTELAIERVAYNRKAGTFHGPPEMGAAPPPRTPAEPGLPPKSQLPGRPGSVQVRPEPGSAPSMPEEEIAAPGGAEPQIPKEAPREEAPTAPQAAPAQKAAPAEDAGVLSGNVSRETLPAGEPKTTGIKNAVTEAERAQRGLPPVPPGTRPFDPVFHETRQRLDSGDYGFLPGAKGPAESLKDFREALVEKPKVLSDQENAALLYDRQRLSNLRDAAVDRIEGARAAGDKAGEAAARQELVRLDYDIDQNDIADKLTGGEWSRSGTSRQRLIQEDYTLARVMRRARALTGGNVPAKTEARLGVLSKKLRDATAAMEQGAEGAVQKDAEKALAAMKRESAHAQRQAGRAIAKVDLSLEFEDLQKELARSLAAARPRAIIPTEAIEIIGKMARNRVQSGMTSLEEVVDSVYQAVRNHIDGVTPRDVRDAISGYGKTSQPSQEEIRKQLREIRAQARLVSALEDAEAGQRPLKTGLQRDPQTPRVRELRRQVNEAMRANGLDTALMDPQQQMRTALDSAKTRLRHQIQDLTKQLETGVNPAAKTPIAYDAEAIALRDERDRLKQALEEMEGPSEMTDAQRLKIAERATERSVQDLEARIASGDIIKRAGPTASPWSPKLADLKQRQRALQKQLADLRDAALTPADKEAARLRAYKTRLTTQEEELTRRIVNRDFAPRTRKPLTLDAGAAAQKARVVALKRMMDGELRKLERANRTGGQKLLDFIVRWGRGVKLSGTATVSKLTAAASYRTFVSQPVEDVATAIIGKTPGTIRAVAEKSPRFGGTVGEAMRSQAKAFTMSTRKALEGVATQGWKGLGKDVASYLKTGTGELDLLYGKPHDISNEFSEWFGHLHGALKTPAKRAEFFRSLERRAMNAQRYGIPDAAGKMVPVDLSNPVHQMQLGAGAYLDANRAILMQDNVATNILRTGLKQLRDKGLYAEASAIEALVPIVKVPTNFVSEATEYAAGGLKAARRYRSIRNAAKLDAKLAGAPVSGKALKAATLEKLSPEDADFIMRNLGKQFVGVGLLALGYVGYKHLGGYYQQGEDRGEGELQPGEAEIAGFHIPHNLLHHASTEMLQMGAMLHRVQDQFEARGKEPSATEGALGLPAGTAQGVLKAVGGLVEQTPFVEEPIRAARAIETSGGVQQFAGAVGRGMVLPPNLQIVAKWMDQPENATATVPGDILKLLGITHIDPNRRYPRHILEEIAVGIPGLRERVPEEKE